MTARIRFLLGAVMLFAAARPAQAQRAVFEGIAWGTPADGVRLRLESLGFALGGATQAGDQEFVRADGAVGFAEMREGRLTGFTLVDRVRGDGVAERFTALADSLQAALGPADEAEQGTGFYPRPHRLWVRGLASVSLYVSWVGQMRQVRLSWRGPGWYDEMDRRQGRLPQPAGFTTVSATSFLRIAVDTTVRGRPDGVTRGRFRIEYVAPITPTLEGVPQDPLDAVVYEMDLDCEGRRARLISRVTYLEGRQTGSDRPATQSWTVPQRDGHYDRGLTAVCRARRG
ncbi:MAG TPA: hypothetical protein VK358_01835 [Longimicrobium sp.]|nr:hypothetical protein [Longimicrobium sp.]